MAGDRCVRGEETYFFELVRECPALPPLGLFIAFNIEFYYPNNDITFHLTQLQVNTHTICTPSESSSFLVHTSGLEGLYLLYLGLQ